MLLELPAGYQETETGLLFGQQDLQPAEFPWARLIWKAHTDRTRPDALELTVGQFAFIDRTATETFTIDADGDINVVNGLAVGDDLIVTGDATITGTVNTRNMVADGSKLDDIEDNATRDQTDTEIETAYNNRVAVVSQIEAETGTATTVRRWTAQRVAQAVAAAFDDDVVITGSLDVGSTLDVTGAVNIGEFSLGVGEDAMLALKGNGIATDDPLLLMESQDTGYQAGIEMRVLGKTGVKLWQSTGGSGYLSAMQSGMSLILQAENGIYLKSNDSSNVLQNVAGFVNDQVTIYGALKLEEQASISATPQSGWCGLIYYNDTLWFQDEAGDVTDLLAGGSSGVDPDAAAFTAPIAVEGGTHTINFGSNNLDITTAEAYTRCYVASSTYDYLTLNVPAATFRGLTKYRITGSLIFDLGVTATCNIYSDATTDDIDNDNAPGDSGDIRLFKYEYFYDAANGIDHLVGRWL
jgi:hypothetical protein